MQLETARLYLRDYAPGDDADIREVDSDPEVQRYRGGQRITEEQTRRWLARTEELRRAVPRIRYPLVLARKDSDEAIGACLFAITDDARRAAESGYLLKRRYWGQGYTTEAARAVLDFGFGTLGLHHIRTQANPENVGSWRVMEKLGLRREGRLREADLTATGEWRDIYRYAILDREWPPTPRNA